MSDFYKKIIAVQSTLKAPKSQHNSFGKYKYRSCEDIMEAVKPILAEQGLAQFVSDEIVQVGDRFYVKATVTVTDGKESHSASAYARESLSKKGMDDAQVTGATSSYARKYALNGMYNIDDSKDQDTDSYQKQTNARSSASIDCDSILKSFVDSASSANESELKESFAKAWKSLSSSSDHRAKAKEIYDIRLAELNDN